MRKEAAHGKLANRESAIECTRKPHATRSAARQEASPQIMRRFIRIAAVPQTAKHARRIAGGPQAHHRFRRAHQAANRRHASEAKTTRYRGASRGQRRDGGFRYVRERSNAAAAQHVRQESHLQNGRRGCNGARGAAFFRNDTHSTTFSRRTVRSKRVKTAASKSSSRSGKNANAPQPKRHQEGHDKKAPIVPMKSERANQSATKAKKPRPPMLWPNKFLASRRATRVSKPWSLLNARSV